ncbi:ankyrin repeat-containing domain protein, partial [Lasiosphaeris hirsuta]
MSLADFLRDGFPVDLRDQLLRTPLHLAVKAANLDAVKRLLYQGKASVTRKDSEGRSPLNIAVQEAAHRTWNPGGPPDSDLQKIYTQIINMLIKNNARVDDKDNDGKTPWSYAEGDGNQWIRRL